MNFMKSWPLGQTRQNRYILGGKVLHDRVFFLSGDHKLYERKDDAMHLVLDVRAAYNAHNRPRPLAEGFENNFLTGGYSGGVSFIDNFYLDAIGSTIFATFSIGTAPFTVALP